MAATAPTAPAPAPTPLPPNYKWTALANTTAAVFMSQLDGSIVLIALPAIFVGIGLDPLEPQNVGFLLWMLMGYRLTQAVLVVTVDWRLIFWVNVPVGIYGTVWAYLKLRETRSRTARARIDWWGNVTFAVGLSAILVASTYGIQPYGGHVMGWTNPRACRRWQLSPR